MNKPLPAFRAVCSQPNSLMNAMVPIGAGLTSLIVLGVLGLTLWMTFTRLNQPAINMLLLIVSFAITGATIFMWRRAFQYTDIDIDERGITYRNRFNMTVVRRIGWDDLVGNPEQCAGGAAYDVIEKCRSVPTAAGGRMTVRTAQWWLQGSKGPKSHEELFRGKHVLSLFHHNRAMLTRAFLLGLAHFRPDLRVDPGVFDMYCIEHDTYVYDDTVRTSDVVAITIGVGVFFLVMWLLPL